MHSAYTPYSPQECVTSGRPAVQVREHDFLRQTRIWLFVAYLRSVWYRRL